jgi:trafficking protein particle complex subunit 13
MSATASQEQSAAGHRRLEVCNVRIAAEMQTPSTPAGFALPLSAYDENEREEKEVNAQGDGGVLLPGESLQRIIRYELNEEGSHVLAVTVTYTEKMLKKEGGEEVSTGARVRTFRKLYQFVSQALIGVRTKAGELAATKSKEGEVLERYVLEAQLENLGGVGVSLEVCNQSELSAHLR